MVVVFVISKKEKGKIDMKSITFRPAAEVASMLAMANDLGDPVTLLINSALREALPDVIHRRLRHRVNAIRDLVANQKKEAQ
jgi:hypothetical protein